MHIKLWFEQMKLEYPARAKNPLITLLNGKRACITRLLSPLGIPFEKNEYAEFLIRRFVSLIPTYQENSYSVCSKLNGIWLSNNVNYLKFLRCLFFLKFLILFLACFKCSLSIIKRLGRSLNLLLFGTWI